MILNSIRYCLSKKQECAFYNGRVLDGNDFSYGSNEKWDLNNFQVYERSQTNKAPGQEFFSLETRRLSADEQNKYYNEYLKDRDSYGLPLIIEPWMYGSGAMKSRSRINIWKPGKISICCNMPQGDVVPGIWLFDEWHESHGNDELGRSGDCYFERDIVESGPSRDQRRKCVFFSAHDGESSSNKYFSNDGVLGDFGGYNWYSIEWDGFGGFLWRLNGVIVFEDHKLLHKDINPKLLFTLAVTKPLQYNVKWDIKTIYMS